MMVSNASAAALFRIIEQAGPTLLLDEADSFVKTNEDLRGIIDAGHRYDGNVVRCVETPDGFEPRLFSVWAAMVLAAIGHLPSTIEDRCVKVRQRRRLKEEKVDTLRIGRTGNLETIARKAARWVKDNAAEIEGADPIIPTNIINRQADNWLPLFAVADLAGPRWGQYARDAAVKIFGSGETSMRELLLTDIQELFNTPLRNIGLAEQFATPLPGALFTKEILQFLHSKDDRPWPEWGKDRKPMTGPQLATMLKPLRIPTGKAVRRGEEVAKGYRREDFADAFKRYARAPDV
jgi:putative DNA primase/helicase